MGETTKHYQHTPQGVPVARNVVVIVSQDPNYSDRGEVTLVPIENDDGYAFAANLVEERRRNRRGGGIDDAMAAYLVRAYRARLTIEDELEIQPAVAARLVIKSGEGEVSASTDAANVDAVTQGLSMPQ